jgi:RNA polymerase sigma factor (sigma-70 family)
MRGESPLERRRASPPDRSREQKQESTANISTSNRLVDDAQPGGVHSLSPSMQQNSDLRGPGRFPSTRWSLIVAARSPEPEERQRALGILTAAYWKPVYKYIRLRWDKDNEQAQDLTQDFFLRILEKDFLAQYDPQKARLRTFLRVCVDHLIANEDKAARRLKRGGEMQFLSLDFESAEGELQQIEIPSPDSMEDFFEREWVRSVFSLSLERLRQECEGRGKQTHFRLLEFYDIDEGGKELTYEEVGKRFELKTTDVTNYLAYARREFRRIVLEQLREMTGSEEEFRREARTLLGTDTA